MGGVVLNVRWIDQRDQRVHVHFAAVDPSTRVQAWPSKGIRTPRS
jgi:hypothetical protein